MRLILLFNLPFAVSPHMIVLPGFATLVIVCFENCSRFEIFDYMFLKKYLNVFEKHPVFLLTF